MRLWNKIVDIAVEEANKSSYYFPMGAVIFKKNQIISVGHNQIIPIEDCKTFDPQIVNIWKDKKHKIISVHAEMAALLNAERFRLNGASILVVRLNIKKKFRVAKPCNNCLGNLIFAGIKKIHYSINQYPYFEEMKV